MFTRPNGGQLVRRLGLLLKLANTENANKDETGQVHLPEEAAALFECKRLWTRKDICSFAAATAVLCEEMGVEYRSEVNERYNLYFGTWLLNGKPVKRKDGMLFLGVTHLSTCYEKDGFVLELVHHFPLRLETIVFAYKNLSKMGPEWRRAAFKYLNIDFEECVTEEGKLVVDNGYFLDEMRRLNLANRVHIAETWIHFGRAALSKCVDVHERYSIEMAKQIMEYYLGTWDVAWCDDQILLATLCSRNIFPAMCRGSFQILRPHLKERCFRVEPKTAC